MRVNAIVKYASPAAGEEDFRFIVIEVNGDRAMCELICDESIPPVETLLLSDIVEANQATIDGLTITEDKLTNAMFHDTALDAQGSCSKGDCRRVARMMLCAQDLVEAIENIANCWESGDLAAAVRDGVTVAKLARGVE